MNRRRRRSREIDFSFDSFLDVVANVVGIIIRLILVVWVGARSYTSLHPPVKPAAPAAAIQTEQQEPQDPLQGELAEHRRELAALQARLLDPLRQAQLVEQKAAAAAGEMSGVAARRKQLDQERASLPPGAPGAATGAALSLAELRERSVKLSGEIQALAKLPPLKQTLHYQTPVSRPVHSDELFFECRQGRVTFLDLAALLAEVRGNLDEKGKELRTRWEVTDVAGPVGAFQLRYTLAREHGPLDGVAGSDTPNPDGAYHCGLNGWEIEPVTDPRGETEAKALAAGSDFRQIVDPLDPQQATVTFWVYPDSFPLFRRLRDYLYERDVVVAGRPLPDGAPILFGRHGTASRGQ
jgi:hypothetical protein